MPSTFLMAKINKNDFVEIEYSSPQIENGKKVQDAFVLGDGRFMPDFEKELEGMKDNEEKSAEFAEVYLPLILYTPLKIQTIKSLVLATKMPQNPNNYLEQLLCDADLDNLGRLDFFELGEKVRIELGIPDNEKWYEQQLKFLTNHQYHTDVARTLRDSGKEANVKKLEKMIQEAKC